MSLSYYFKFVAPASKTDAELEDFLKSVEFRAQALGFPLTKVLNVPFDNRERREFSRRLGSSFHLESERLKGVALPAEEDTCRHNPTDGSCRLVPRHGVVLVVTNEHECETCFGFLKFPAAVHDINGRLLVETGLGSHWVFKNFVDTPDMRYRQIVKLFSDAGYLESQRDEYRQ